MPENTAASLAAVTAPGAATKTNIPFRERKPLGKL